MKIQECAKLRGFILFLRGERYCDLQLCSPYADDTIIFACGSDLGSVLESLEGDAALLSLWFENNCMKMNEDKSHLLVFGNKDNEVTVNISGFLIKENDEEKLLRVTLIRD